MEESCCVPSRFYWIFSRSCYLDYSSSSCKLAVLHVIFVDSKGFLWFRCHSRNHKKSKQNFCYKCLNYCFARKMFLGNDKNTVSSQENYEWTIEWTWANFRKIGLSELFHETVPILLTGFPHLWARASPKIHNPLEDTKPLSLCQKSLEMQVLLNFDLFFSRNSLVNRCFIVVAAVEIFLTVKSPVFNRTDFSYFLNSIRANQSAHVE